MRPHHVVMKGERALRDGGTPERLRRQQEARDVAAAIDGAVDAERLVGVQDGDVGRAEKVEILQRLSRVPRLVAARNPERIVELKSALAPPLPVDAAIFTRKGEVAGIRPAARGGRIHRLAESLRRRPGGDLQPPGLAVAPGGGLLRRCQNALDGRPRNRLRQEAAAGKAISEQLLEHADAILGLVSADGGLSCSVHDHRPLVGILLNGTSLSTRISPGNPRTRSAMMLRRISSVPPAIRIDGEDNSICWNCPAASTTFGSLRTPAAPSRSIA